MKKTHNSTIICVKQLNVEKEIDKMFVFLLRVDIANMEEPFLEIDKSRHIKHIRSFEICGYLFVYRI